MLTFKPTIQKQIERIVKRYPVESGQCSRCAKQIYNLLTSEGFSAQIGRMETDFRFLVTHDGVRLSHRVGNSLAYHEFVRVGDHVVNGMTVPLGVDEVE